MTVRGTQPFNWNQAGRSEEWVRRYRKKLLKVLEERFPEVGVVLGGDQIILDVPEQLAGDLLEALKALDKEKPMSKDVPTQEQLEAAVLKQFETQTGGKKAWLIQQTNPFQDGHPSISLEEGVDVSWQEDEDCWVVDVGTYDPGVRYYPDGSGQPPSWDYNTVLTTPSLEEAAQRAVEEWIKGQEPDYEDGEGPI